MSRSVDRAGRARDRGFTLIEIIVALGILSVVLVALLPQLVVGIRATGTARLISQAKGVSSGELERMRNLPFHLARSAGPYRDVLDNYYPNLTPPVTSPLRTSTCSTPIAGWSGYVSPTVPLSARCDYEPSTGAFRRTVRLVPAAAGIAPFAVVTDTQFLSAATPPVPVTPVTGYDTQSDVTDIPAGSQIGVTVTVLYTERGTVKPVTMYTQIAAREQSTTRVRAEADVRVVDVGSVTPGAVPLTLSAGVVHLKGSVSFSSTATASLTAVSAGLATGNKAGGATSSTSAPPSATTSATSAIAGALGSNGCLYACWGNTSSSAFPMAAEDGLPVVGSSSVPASALITSLGSNSGISFGNDTTGNYRTGLQLAPPLVRLDPSTAATPSGLSGCASGSTGTSAYLSGSGYLTTSPAGASGLVESCAVAKSAAIELFPTSPATFAAPHGVVRVTLERASARCAVTGTARTASVTPDYRAVVQYWNGASYTTLPAIDTTNAVDELDAVPLTTTSVGGAKKLGDYIASWSSLTPAEMTQDTRRGASQLTMPGVVTIASQPVRPDAGSPTGFDQSSMVSVTVGVLSCRADDAR